MHRVFSFRLANCLKNGSSETIRQRLKNEIVGFRSIAKSVRCVFSIRQRSRKGLLDADRPKPINRERGSSSICLQSYDEFHTNHRPTMEWVDGIVCFLLANDRGKGSLGGADRSTINCKKGSLESDRTKMIVRRDRWIPIGQR